MLSRLVVRSGAFGPSLLRRPDVQQKVLTLIRCAGSVQQAEGSSVQPSTKPGSDMGKCVQDWTKAHELYYGPERDHVNFPHPIQPDKTPSVRMGIIPDSWFTMFYDKTGVTGPYVLGVGVLATLLSTELWVVEHGFTEVIAFWAAVIFLVKKIGPNLSKYLDTQEKELMQSRWWGPIERNKRVAQESIDECEKAIWREAGTKYLFDAKRENVDLQLEAVYRQRLAEIHQQVKKRLDYQVDVESERRNVEQRHMVNWIVDNVVKSITPQQEKESLNKCIQDLKALAVKA